MEKQPVTTCLPSSSSLASGASLPAFQPSVDTPEIQLGGQILGKEGTRQWCLVPVAYGALIKHRAQIRMAQDCRAPLWNKSCMVQISLDYVIVCAGQNHIGLEVRFFVK